MAGVATSGVILSTFTLAADEDYGITILSDACADPTRKPASGAHDEPVSSFGDGTHRRSMECVAADKAISRNRKGKDTNDNGIDRKRNLNE